MASRAISEYRKKRKDTGLSREAAAEIMNMSDDKLERIENGKQKPTAQDISLMAKAYCSPELCNYYCHNECEIGEKYVPEVLETNLPSITLQLLDTIYKVNDLEKILVNVTADGKIDDDEIEDLVKIQGTLEKLSVTIEALQLCVEKKMVNGEINKDKYVKAHEAYING